MSFFKMIASITSNIRTRGMGAPVTGMAPSAASIPNRTDGTTAAVEAAAARRASPPDLCVDCFRGGEQLVTALLDCRFFTKGRPPAPLTIAGWHAAEPAERRRGSFGSGEEGGGGGSERRRRPGCGAAADEAAEAFQHHVDADAYIREYRRQRNSVMEAAMRKSRKKESDASGNLLIIERLKLFEDNAKAAEQKLFPQRANEKEKESNRTAKQVTVVQIITAETQLQMQPTVEDISPGNNSAVDFLSDCYNVQRVAGVCPPDRQRSAEDLLSSASRLHASDFLSPCRFNCLSGRKVAPPTPTTCESPPPLPAGTKLRHHPKTTTAAPPPPPPSAESKARSRSREEPMLGRCSLVLPQISQDLCASFRPETQIDDVKRLKDARRSRSFQHHGAKPDDLTPRRREAATAPQESSACSGAMPLPWSSLVLARRPKTRPRLIMVGTRPAESKQADVKKRAEEIFSSFT